jgi:tripartite motif-containing protein 71
MLQRRESLTAFDDLSASEAEDVLGAAFSDVLSQLDGDPARLLSDLQIEEVVGEHGALVPDGEGGSQLIETPIPIRSQVPGEEAKPVDLTLTEAEGNFVSQTPATDISLPGALGGEIQVGAEVAISALPGEGEVGARRFGDKDLFFANTDTDTDTFVAPLTHSVEVFEQLRSPKSPETFRFGLSIPDGSKLRPDGFGGAEIVDSAEKRVAFVPAPYAVDAQGTDVPVAMGVEGESLVLEIPHRSRDIAYPLLLDPQLVTEEWYWNGGNTFGLGYWGWQETADYENSYSCIVSCWGTGLYARSKGSNYLYGGNTWGQWVYTAPNSTAFISRTIFWTLRGSVNNCFTYHPHGYVGIYNVFSGSYNSLGTYSPPSFSATSFDTGSVGGYGTRLAVVGIGTGAAPSQLACGHDFYVGGATIYQDDPENPSVDFLTGMPGGWIADTPAFTLTTRGGDPGLGVRKITFTRDGQPTIERPVGCTGTAASRCPTTRSEEFNLSGLSFDEGKRSAAITVEDATGRKATHSWSTYVDLTKPDLLLSGQLAVATEEDEGEEKDPEDWDELSLPVYKLQIKATDGSPSPDSAKRSGVKKLEVLLDGVKKQEWEQGCPASSCSMEKTYSLQLNNLGAGKHVLKVIATDGVGKKREREIEFEYIPATGMKDEYVMHYFPLPDGEGNEAEEEHPDRPELAVNVMNGNLVYREEDVDVEGYSVDLEVERYYNSLLPEEENTEWGRGWTLAQTPDFEPEATEGPEAPTRATMIRASGAVEGSVALPTVIGAEKFDPELQAVITAEAGGGYEVADATGETDTAIAFDGEGKVAELRTEGLAKVDYDYEEGSLAEIAVKDPASTGKTPQEIAAQEELGDITPAYKSSFGSEGTGQGQFKVATDVAFDPTDATSWVADSDNDRLQHFGATGEYLGQIATCEDPAAVEIDALGDIYVACASGHLVQKYNDKGEVLKKIASHGSGPGQVIFPLDLALDPEGDLWVSDDENDRLEEFNPKGEFIRSIYLGSSYRPWGIDVAPNGNIWVTEPIWFDRVSVFDHDGKLLRRIGSRGTSHSQFNFPADVEVDERGNAWVTDARNDRVQVFDQDGSYITQFGEEGSGEGQLDTDWWLRIATGPSGEVLLTDSGNARVQRWKTSAYLAAYKSSFGSEGTGQGQFKVATDVAFDPTDATSWVADSDNDRLQHFGATGEYLGQIATCEDPAAVEIDALGDIYVACASGHLVQKYNDKGEVLKKIASHGSGPGQVIFPLDLALDPEGDLWVSDDENDRLEEFNPKGEFIRSIYLGSSYRPWGIDVAPNGNIWVTEPIWFDRVSVFDHDGKLLRRIGSRGTSHSQFNFPADVEVDERGNAWVTDARNDRVQVFDQDGSYITQFGEEGSGEGQLDTDWWLRIATGPSGEVLLTDSGNARVQRWRMPNALMAAFSAQDDPRVTVDVSAGLVQSVEGEEAGEHSYEHDGDLLTAHVSPEGEIDYDYDEAERLTKVTLPNGTWGAIEYGATDGRVKKVTVAPEGQNPKTTSFTYVDEPRRTTVLPPDAPAITYDIGEDGSVFKWQNALKPPEFEVIAGTLYDVENKETKGPIAPGEYNLVVQAYSEEGIASIEIYSKGNQLISEKTCPQVYEEPAACKKLPDEWVTYTGNHAPGILYLEMVIEDRIGQVASKRFWVNIPYTPPPPPGKPAKPTFASVLKFRQDHGLDLDLDPVQDEFELNDRVFDTINDWIQGKPIAEASMERWGAPLRLRELGELEYRIAYQRQMADAIREWAPTHAPSSYADLYIEESHGGLIYVGFTGNQADQLAALKAGASLLAPTRLVAFPSIPQYALTQLENVEAQVNTIADENPELPITTVSVDVKSNKVSVGASDVQQVTDYLTSALGSAAPFTVFYNARTPSPRAGRERIDGPIQAGDRFTDDWMPATYYCTSGFGAFEFAKRPSDGARVERDFMLTAGHCTRDFYTARRRGEPGGEHQEIGYTTRKGYDIDPGDVDTDVSAIRLEERALTPRRVYTGQNPFAVRQVVEPIRGMEVCTSGVTSGIEGRDVRCGKITRMSVRIDYENQRFYQVEFNEVALGGDSGAPVWQEGTKSAVGILTAGAEDEDGNEIAPSYFTPLLPLAGRPHMPGAFGDQELAPLHLFTVDN